MQELFLGECLIEMSLEKSSSLFLFYCTISVAVYVYVYVCVCVCMCMCVCREGLLTGKPGGHRQQTDFFGFSAWFTHLFYSLRKRWLTTLLE